jgi:DNA repair protein RecN (Recombination protein N)
VTVWREIRLQSLGVIDSACLELGPGFTVITGETGAGKTMVVTALALLRGVRADSTLVRHGSPRCRVEARVDIADFPDVRGQVSEAGGELDHDDELIVARTVTTEGRSRAFLGGAGVPAGALASVSDRLVAVHGQSDQHRLLRPVAQRRALDRFAASGVAVLLDEYRPAYERWRAVDALLRELIEQAADREREVEQLRYGLEQVEAVAPRPGEDTDLRLEEDRLANAEALQAATARAHACISGGDDADADATTLLSTARQLLDSEREHDPSVAELSDRASDLAYQLADLGADLASYATGVEADPVRLATVQERRATLAALARQYGSSHDDVLAWSERAVGRLMELEGTDDRIAELTAEREALGAALLDLASRLSRARVQAAQRLSDLVSAELHELSMPHARLEVAVRFPDPIVLADLGPDGADEVEMLLSASTGAPARPLAKGASGGELSRVMLGLEVVLADTMDTPTFVFDEVDAGIGGRAAIEVGRRLARLASRAQVIVVTHLPQVAAFADHHHRVLKTDNGSVTTSDVMLLDADGRVAELSRMLAGMDNSAAAQTHAREMLLSASAERAG